MTEEKRKINNDRIAGEKAVMPLNNFLEIEIGGVTYRVKSEFAEHGQMGALLDLAAMEKINRIA